MPLRICVGEDPALQELVGGELDSWHDRGGAESSLLHFGKVVFWIAVQHHLAHWHQRELVLWPGLCGIKWVEVLLQLIGNLHNLNIQFIFDCLA